MTDAPNTDRISQDATEVFDLLHRMARHRMRSDHQVTLQPTALANEAWIRLFGSGETRWNDRQHFVKLAAAAMHSILIDYARRRQAGKRPPAEKRVGMHEFVLAYEDRAHDLLDLDESLRRLAEEQPQLAKFAHLRFFGGASIPEAAKAIGVSEGRGSSLWRNVKAIVRADLEGF